MRWLRRAEGGEIRQAPGMTELKIHRDTPEYVNWIITVIAVIMTIALTAIAFWLSYEHLHDVADDHGLSGARAWAWPATLDAFIVIGETLILRASIMRTVDKWAIFLTIIGSVGSIVLNVVGVGTDGDALDYTVAAVPPVAALLAFGILMRQLHQALSRRIYGTAPEIIPVPHDRADRRHGVRAGDDDDGMVPEYDASGIPATVHPGYDAGIEALRGDAGDTPGAPWSEARDHWNAGQLRRDAEDMITRVPPVPVVDPDSVRPYVPGEDAAAAPRPYVPRLSLVRDKDTGDTEDSDQGQTAVSRPVPGTRDADTGDTGTTRPVPRQAPSRVPGTGVTSRVRDILRDNPGTTDDEIRDMFAGEGVPRNTINKSIKRVRNES